MSLNDRQDLEAVTFNAIKTIFDLASDKESRLNNRRIYNLANEIVPDVINESSTLFGRLTSPHKIAYYRKKAELESRKTGKKISAVQVLERVIRENSELLELISDDEEADSVRLENQSLQKLKPFLKDKGDSENEWILQDMMIDREIEEKLIKPKINGKISVYNSNGKTLIVRRLHPDKPEHTLGADIIFERYNRKLDKVRFVYLQYKIWDYNNNTLYLGQGNVGKQIRKLNNQICSNSFCKCIENISQDDLDFRLPYCAAFIRPTNRIQESKKRLLTSGIYFPVCKTLSLINQSKDLKKNNITGQYLTHEIFEKLFQAGIVGSKWFSTSDIEHFYQKHNILQKDENLILHVQSYSC